MAKGLDYVINLLDGSSGGVDKAKAKIGEVDHAIEGAHSRSNAWAKTIGSIGLMIGGLFAADKIVDFGKEALNSAKTMRLATAQVAQGLQTTGGIAGRSLDELKEKAESLENTTLFGSDQTLGAESLLLTFTQIRGKIFDEAIPAIQDLATRMGGDGPADLKGASVQIGKALNDPIRGITALQRVGVSFTKVQKDQIEGLVKHNQLAQAQTLILHELNTEFGGSAAAARIAAGPQANLKVAYEKLLKAVGPLIQEGLTPLVTWMAKGVTAAAQFVGGLGGLSVIAQTAWGVIKGVGEAAKDLAIGIGLTTVAIALAYPQIIAYTAVLLINGAASMGLAAASGILTAAQWALNVAMSANPIGVIIVGVGALIGGLIYAYHHSERFRAILSGIGSVAGVLIDIFVGLGKAVIGAFTFNPELIKQGVIQSARAINEIKDKGFSGIFNGGYDESIKASRQAEKDEKLKEATAPIGGKPNENAGLPGKGGLKPKTAPALTSGGNTGGHEATAAGRSVKNLTITFQSMIKEFTMNVTNLKGEDGTKLKRMITELLASAAADTEILAGE